MARQTLLAAIALALTASPATAACPAVGCLAPAAGAGSTVLSATLSLPYATFAASQAQYTRALANALTTAAALPSADVQVTLAEPAANATVLHFQVFGADEGAAANGASAVAAQFDAAARPSAALADALACQGVAAAVTLGSAQPPPPPPLTAYTGLVTGLQIAFDIPLGAWLQHGPAYNKAVTSAVAQQLGVELSAVWVTQQVIAAKQGTLVMLDVISPDQPSEISTDGVSIPTNALHFARLFGTGAAVGAPGSPALVASLRAFGLPITACYYSDQV